MMDTNMKPGSAIVEKQHLLATGRGNSSANKDAALMGTSNGESKDAALIQDEERMMDEEITSDEESELAEKMERKHLTVALVKSVVESGSGGTLAGNQDSTRYELRRTRRPAREDLKRLERNQSSKNKGPDQVGSSGGSPQLKAGLVDNPPPIFPRNSTVPNPLAMIPFNQGPPMRRSETSHPAPVSSSIAIPDPTKSMAPVVPSPLPAAIEVDSKPAAYGDGTDKRKVTINEPFRLRGFSIDLDSMGLEFPDEGSTTTDPNASDSRSRAFSFECFAFGINADEPLPPLDQQDGETASAGRSTHDSLCDSSASKRPRGDSIIFDPSSFQEGGIHEQNALEKARAPSSEIPGMALRRAGAVKPDSAASSAFISTEVAETSPLQAKTLISGVAGSFRTSIPGEPVHSISSSATNAIATNTATDTPRPPITSSSSTSLPNVSSYTTTTTISNSEPTTTTTTTTVITSPAANAASLSLELLNKDGRIGIYLPEARKARIARFHAKRARRIWRKRIKYDCRKKLADSRPRIKGRFVKRSDMEDE